LESDVVRLWNAWEEGMILEIGVIFVEKEEEFVGLS